MNKRKSLAHLERRIKLHLAPAFSGWKLINIKLTEIRAFVVNRLSAGASRAEINRELAVLKRMFSLAAAAEKLDAVPKIKMLQEDNVRSGFFEHAAFEAVKQRLGPDLQAVVEFAYITGWRVPSEVLPLEWRRVDFAAGEVRLDPGSTKNKKPRIFPMTARLRELLQTQRERTDAFAREHDRIVPWVFHRNGQQILSFRKAFQTACKEAGCPGRIPHDFRRTAVRNLVRAGIPESVAMKMTGHKTRSVFDRYDITSGKDLENAAQKLDAHDGKQHTRSTQTAG